MTGDDDKLVMLLEEIARERLSIPTLQRRGREFLELPRYLRLGIVHDPAGRLRRRSESRKEGLMRDDPVTARDAHRRFIGIEL
jgi:hypothetical protein